MKLNPVVWFEIYVQDMARARKFYETVFQCTLEPLAVTDGPASDMEMFAFPMEQNKDGAGGMLVRRNGVTPGMGGTLVYFGCEDCAQEQARVQAAGGQVQVPKFAIGPYGFCALLVDTEGNLIGVHSMQ